ncbi:MAG: hypothetical protein MUF45_05715 [Spirosomaceae bacterium]|nr:hypothetical protein [Spirosomataceae bacterium]
MQITYQLSEQEFTYDFFKALKKTLKGKKKVEFSVKVEDSPYKMSKEDFENMVLASEKSENQYLLTSNEFDSLVKQFEDDETFNPVSEIEKFKIKPTQ